VWDLSLVNIPQNVGPNASSAVALSGAEPINEIHNRAISVNNPGFTLSLGLLSPPIPSFSGIRKVLKFY
jgi:hypothetical protein